MAEDDLKNKTFSLSFDSLKYILTVIPVAFGLYYGLIGEVEANDRAAKENRQATKELKAEVSKSKEKQERRDERQDDRAEAMEDAIQDIRVFIAGQDKLNQQIKEDLVEIKEAVKNK